ncbi:MAG: threonine ammonia-lyase [Erysipelotrichaceae bacterium]
MDMKMVYEAKEVLDGIATKTPIMKADKIDPNLLIKAENLQMTGAFKIRGAYYKISKLSEEEKARGVICASAGNHAQGVGYSCKAMGVKGIVVMPKSAPLSKIEATRAYGVKVELQGDSFNEAYVYAQNLQKETGAVFIEPFDDEYVIAGQGTIGLEILEEVPDVDVVLVPIGGGGLASGIAYAIKNVKPECKVYGVEASNAACMKESLLQDEIVTLDTANTIADGIAVKCPGTITYDLCKEYLDGVLSVSEEEIAASILTLVEKMKLVAEGAGAASVAAAMFKKIGFRNRKCVAVLSGGNIDVNFLSKIIDLGLIKTGRKCSMEVIMIDKPGNLSKFATLISDLGANIVSIEHDRVNRAVLSDQCKVHFVMETFDKAHIKKISEALNENGYKHKIFETSNEQDIN